MIHTTYWVPRGEGRLLYRLLNVNRTNNKIIVYAVTILWYLRRLKFYQEIFTKKKTKKTKTLIVMFCFDEFKEVEVQINHQIALKAVNFSIIKIYFLALKLEHFLVSSYRLFIFRRSIYPMNFHDHSTL